MFVYRELRLYGPEPWTVGQYFPIEDATGDLDRLTNGAIVGAATLAVAALLAVPLQMPVAEIRPGMVGIGRTVFEGTRVEEFKVKIIGKSRAKIAS